jgi:hypothetical protein
VAVQVIATIPASARDLGQPTAQLPGVEPGAAHHTMHHFVVE